MLAEGKPNSILTDFLIPGNNCHLCWPFPHPVLNIFINNWRISSKPEILFPKHHLLHSSLPKMHGSGDPHPGQLLTT